MMEIAVIGAGSAGLTAARHLLVAGLRPTVFEASPAVGGAWSVPSDKMWDGMRTNLSKYTCRFADWPWGSSEENGVGDDDGTTEAATFPSVREMHGYLKSYSSRFLNDDIDFRLECEVTRVEPTAAVSFSEDVGVAPRQGPRRNGYNVEWIDRNTNTHSKKEFDGVVMASGFFRTPNFPSFLRNYKADNQGKATTTTTPSSSICNNKRLEVIHSSNYKTNESYRDKNVAVIGSSFSALEIASDVSRSASRVVNVVSSIPWVLPRWVVVSELSEPEQDDGAESSDTREDASTTSSPSSPLTILPIDLAFYQRTDPFPQKEHVQLTPDACLKKHDFLRSLAGHKQKHSPLGEPTDRDHPPFLAISDEYLDLIREGKIEVMKGRLEGIIEDDDGTGFGLCISDSRTVNGVDVVICCTGYAPNLQRILSSSVLETLEYDSEDTFGPLSLAWDVLHPSLPGLAFCGMYRGPYMGIMDLQARLLAGTFSGRISLDERTVQSALEVSKLIRLSRPRPQFPRFDYIGYMDTLAMLCYNGKYPTANTRIGDMIVPSFYQPDEDIIKQASSELQEEMRQGQDGSRMPELILRSILGNWTYDRDIVHFQTQKSERVSGTVRYTKYSHRSKSDQDNDNTEDSADDKYVLYREDGLYELTPTQKFEVFREYEYVTKDDALEIYFVEGGARADLFLSLKFIPETPQSEEEDGHWVMATSDHLCIKDLYSATFRVKLDGVSASEVVIKYRVKGPSKDYESTTVLKPNFF